jgi:hypothetical protein
MDPGFMFNIPPWWKWMNYVRDKNVEIKDLVLAGTHDSGAWNITLENPKLEVEPFATYRNIPLATKVIKSFSITQNRNLYQQCYDGFRLFDFRIAYGTDKEWYVWHGFRNVRASAALKQLADFCREQPTEVLLIWFRVDNPLENDEMRASVDELLAPYLNIMVDHSVMSVNSTLKAVQDAKKNWMVFVNKRLPESGRRYGNYNILTGKWFNEWSPSKMVDNLQGELDAMPAKSQTGSYYVMQWIVTPDTEDVIKAAISTYIFLGIWPKTLKEQAEDLNDKMKDFFLRGDNFNKMKSRVGGIWGDFFQETQVLNYVKRWNDIVFPA